MPDPIPACAHYWQIAPANGSESSVGVCQLCGKVRVFKNSINVEDIDSYLGTRNREKGRKRRGEEEEHGIS